MQKNGLARDFSLVCVANILLETNITCMGFLFVIDKVEIICFFEYFLVCLFVIVLFFGCL